MSSDFHYKYPKKRRQRPLRTLANENNGLSISFRGQENRIYSCIGNSFLVHATNDMPNSFKLSDFVEFGYGISLEVVISPIVVDGDENLRRLSVDERKCYFEGERSLKYFKTYSKGNCEHECRSNQTFERCGCVPFNVIRNSSMDVCGLRGSICSDSFEERFDSCNCFSPCSSIDYETEIYSIKLSQNYSDDIEKNVQINFRFKDNEFFSTRRYLQFTFEDFISYVGGLLGLFAGISVLSIFEIVFFFVVRPLSNIFIK